MDKRVAIAVLMGLLDGMLHTVERTKFDLEFMHEHENEDRISDDFTVLNEFTKQLNHIWNDMKSYDREKVAEYCDEEDMH